MSLISSTQSRCLAVAITSQFFVIFCLKPGVAGSGVGIERPDLMSVPRLHDANPRKHGRPRSARPPASGPRSRLANRVTRIPLSAAQ
jgi:hypothetical protein